MSTDNLSYDVRIFKITTYAGNQLTKVHGFVAGDLLDVAEPGPGRPTPSGGKLLVTDLKRRLPRASLPTASDQS